MPPYKALETLAESHVKWGRPPRIVLMNYALQNDLREQGFFMQSTEARYEA